jgi:hypothetical protein
VCGDAALVSRAMMHCVRGLLTALVCCIASALSLDAQPISILRCRVVDSNGGVVAGAELSLVSGLKSVVAHGTTDANGSGVLTLQSAAGDYQLVARRIGYERRSQFLLLGQRDTTIDVAITLTPIPPTLPGVTVTEQEDLKRKSYYLTADDIENASRTIIDGTDIFKLRPDMLNARGGYRVCGWIKSVWVNGQRISLVPLDEMALARRGSINERLRTSHPSVDTVLSILRSIHPEHIQEVTYHDCLDMSVGKNNSDMAMFIVLKPGVLFVPGIGSYVDSTSVRRPIPGIDIIGALSGLRATTTGSDAVSLFFLAEGESAVRFRGAGYAGWRPVDVGRGCRVSAGNWGLGF